MNLSFANESFIFSQFFLSGLFDAIICLNFMFQKKQNEYDSFRAKNKTLLLSYERTVKKKLKSFSGHSEYIRREKAKGKNSPENPERKKNYQEAIILYTGIYPLNLMIVNFERKKERKKKKCMMIVVCG